MELEPGDRVRVSEGLKARAAELGFSLAGIADAEASRQMGFYREWIREGLHGEMAYLGRDDAVRRRGDLRQTLGTVRSVLVTAHEYYLEDRPPVPSDASRAVIARYARGDDYHDVVEGKLEELLAWLNEATGGGVGGRAYVDTGPILERELAQRAGLGWFGRNTMLISPLKGSYFFLGVLLLDVYLAPDEPFTEDRCGTCRACLDACPTGALLGRDDNGAPVIDARRCISYLTIELRDSIPVALRPSIGNRVFGCDICQEVCPWNEQFARPTAEERYRPRPGLDGPSLTDLAARLLDVDEIGFARLFEGSPLRRAKRGGLLRNVCVALGNWGAQAAAPVLSRALYDSSPLVRAHAAWALGRVGGPDVREPLRSALGSEADPRVLAELRDAVRAMGGAGG